MSLKVTILGSGTNVPRLARSSSAILIESVGLTLLFDIGPGTIRRLLEYGVTISDLNHIFISHFHPDHSSELAPLLFATKYPQGTARIQPLTLWAGEGLCGFYQGLQAAYKDWIVLNQNQLILNEIDVLAGETFSLKNLRITARPVQHRPESLAYRFEDSTGACVVCTGDTDECETLDDLAQGADLFICDAAFPDGMKVEGHLTPSLAGRIAERASVKRLVLTHLYPACDDEDIVKQAAGTYTGQVIVAEDLMSFIFK